MTSTSAVRSFAITLAIAITIVGPRASGFTIHRTNSTSTTPSTDLSSDDTYRLEVKDDLRRPNVIKIKNDDSKNIAKSNETKTVIDNKSKTPKVKLEQKLNITPTTTAVSTTTENVRIPTISSDTVEVFDSVEDTNFYKKAENLTNNHKESIELKEPVKLTEKFSGNNQTDAPVTLSTPGDQNVTNLDKAEDYLMEIPVRRPNLEEEITTPIDIVTETPIITETSKILSEKAKEEIPITTDLPQTISNVSILSTDDLHAPTVLPISIDEISTVSGNVSDTDVAQTTTDSIHLKVTEPFLGKYPNYTTIIRKGTTASDEITVTSKSENDEMNAETSNTQVNFENAFNITPIPSLEKLRTDLLSNLNTFSINDDMPRGSEKVTREVELSTPYTVESTEPKKQEKVETKRAGFLDNSEKATTAIQASVYEEINEKVAQNGNVGNNPVTETSPDFKKVSASESQSQLAEDELQEEFLKEEVLNNHNENAIKYRDDQTEVKGVNLDKPAVPTANSTEDSLSVQPIARSKSTLYSLGPSYKPMKKIDVQPARQLLRDPDDNSWRNESISSLGIVFKPKISSKSFKEILKNKTQAELNSLIEQTKDDVPDLRVRLEKIAEGRKKKKMNKFGEVVYTDYEENSAESRTQKPESPSVLNSTEGGKMVTPLILQPSIPPEVKLDITTPMTPSKATDAGKEKSTNTLDLFSRLGLDPLTTLKPKNYFNAAEYYDTTDEYDADYVTMMKLDLKKFTPAPRPAPPPRPREPAPPARRPTVQYFPPRAPPPPVNLNNVDTDFERKINLFTFKDYPRIEPRPPFVTVPPLPIATARPEPAVRPPGPADSYGYIPGAPTGAEPSSPAAGVKLDRGSYVIKHYKDFLNAAVDADERGPDFPPCHTTTPPREAFDLEPDRHTFKPRDDEDYYDSRFRKDVLNRFVENFNQNSERFKIDFPVLYNSSVVHRKGHVSPAASRALGRAGATRAPARPSAPPCDLAVELSPAYELHYYVPNQEEREEPRPAPPPDRYGL